MVLCGAGQAVVQFARGVSDGREYAVKFFLDEGSFHAEAALYAAVAPRLRTQLSARAAHAIACVAAPTAGTAGGDGGASDAVRAVQAAGARFLPQVRCRCQGRCRCRCSNGVFTAV